MFSNGKTLIVIVLLSFTATLAIAPTAMGDNSSRAAPAKFVGTFYGDNDRIITYHSDGTLSLVSANMFSDDPAAETAGRKLTPFLGVWKKVGENTIQVSSLSFTTELFGHNFNPNGFIFKTKWLAIYDDAVNGVSPGYTAVNIVVELFLPGQNPIIEAPIQIVPIPDSRAQRLTVE
jgi:hypothetical protein